MKINKDRIRKKLVKFNLTSIFFFILSLVSTTFAWFAFSNVVNNNLEIEVKAWDVNITEGENNVSNEIGIKVESFHPGSETTTKTININNIPKSLSLLFLPNIKEKKGTPKTITPTISDIKNNFLFLNIQFTTPLNDKLFWQNKHP